MMLAKAHPPSAFSLCAGELEQISRIVFAQVDVLQENLPAVLHASRALVAETVTVFARELEERICQHMRNGGQSPHKLPAKTNADLRTVVYESVKAGSLKKHAEQIIELIAEHSNSLEAKLTALREGHE